MHGPLPDWNRYHGGDNCGEPPSQIQKNNLRRYLRESDQDHFDVESEIRILTQIRKNRERIESSAPKCAGNNGQHDNAQNTDKGALILS